MEKCIRVRGIERKMIQPITQTYLVIPVKELLNFATGMLATHEVTKSVLECFDNGKKSFEKLITKRLMPEEGKYEAAKKYLL